ncbi:MAG TPA: cob(I)yrinic acid a,c-diamide adenosyltransferase [Anaerolineae bacterium]|jgi:cob(I)alamin adenosyltransferase|nr:cob(I)yrinic acid a,c-diamide adenosyltransferase [Ardenticatenia bacterium]HQZ70031.1 cob(I)yrinic acid a,c-diamide adenosyltransferase [Anaerolineae bacterium]HRA18856.1 cob(I)yrinic acid a,c-diamide adenosyltransferase [Anaerolineae bacterium]
MKIYTRSGDAGDTGLFGGRRVAKHHPRVEAYGTVDELNAVLGLAVTALTEGHGLLRDHILAIQARLFDLGADLATPDDGKAGAWLLRADDSWAAALEAQIDSMEAGLAPLTSFILPGGSTAAAWLHLARTVCRRAERRAVEAQAAGERLTPAALIYLNRLSDWLFTAARLANAQAGVMDIPWARQA